MAKLNPCKSLNSDLEHSSKCFAAYCKYARRPESKESWTRSVFCPKVVEALGTERKQLRALGIGSGSGEVEYWMLTELKNTYPNILHTSVEPCAEEVTKHKQLAQTNKSKLPGVLFDWRQQTFRKYQQTSGKSEEEHEFHLITAIHSIYFEPDLEKVLEYLYGCLAESGVLVVALDPDVDGVGQLRCQLPLAWDENYHYCSTNHVKAYFDKQHVPYTTLRRPCQVDITPCISQCSPDDDHYQSPASGEGAMLLDFLYQVRDFHHLVPMDDQRKLLRYLMSMCSSIDGDMLVRCDTEYVIVTKLT
ncbi:histamine N-methyltransferase-like [Amphiura filiformis]|uniref:histamine N-methyltransferase-like n=1 Tax=Amphiura filiformis TaxID=82378 RepID=UPI003B22546B